MYHTIVHDWMQFMSQPLPTHHETHVFQHSHDGWTTDSNKSHDCSMTNCDQLCNYSYGQPRLIAIDIIVD